MAGHETAPFATLNADPVVMEHFPAPLRREESDDLADRIAAGLDERLGAVGRRDPGHGVVRRVHRAQPATFDAPFTPPVEVGWRLAAHWD